MQFSFACRIWFEFILCWNVIHFCKRCANYKLLLPKFYSSWKWFFKSITQWNLSGFRRRVIFVFPSRNSNFFSQHHLISVLCECCGGDICFRDNCVQSNQDLMCFVFSFRLMRLKSRVSLIVDQITFAERCALLTYWKWWKLANTNFHTMCTHTHHTHTAIGTKINNAIQYRKKALSLCFALLCLSHRIWC